MGEGMVAQQVMGDRTSFRRHLPYLLSRFLKLSRNESAGGSLPTIVCSDADLPRHYTIMEI